MTFIYTGNRCNACEREGEIKAAREDETLEAGERSDVIVDARSSLWGQRHTCDEKKGQISKELEGYL